MKEILVYWKNKVICLFKGHDIEKTNSQLGGVLFCNRCGDAWFN